MASSKRTITFEVDGNVAVVTGKQEEFFRGNWRLVKLAGRVGTNPATTDIIVDINRNGTTAFAAGKPTFSTTGVLSYTLPTNAIWRDGEFIGFDIDQIGTATVGADLTLTAFFEKV